MAHMTKKENNGRILGRRGIFRTSYLSKRVHDLYWSDNTNCARTMLICLSERYHVPIEQQVMKAAIGLHGAGGYRAQCGLVEGGLRPTGFTLNDPPHMCEELTCKAIEFVCRHLEETIETDKSFWSREIEQ